MNNRGCNKKFRRVRLLSQGALGTHPMFATMILGLISLALFNMACSKTASCPLAGPDMPIHSILWRAGAAQREMENVKTKVRKEKATCLNEIHFVTHGAIKTINNR